MDTEKKNLRVFGYGLGVIATIFGAGGILKHGFGVDQAVLVGCAVVFGVITTLDYKALKLGYQAWMKVTQPIGIVVTTLILGAVFILMFTPVGLLFRLIGKDFLARKFIPGVKSYWTKRPVAVLDKEQYHQQF